MEEQQRCMRIADAERCFLGWIAMEFLIADEKELHHVQSLALVGVLGCKNLAT